MTYFPLTAEQRRWLETAETVAAEALAPRATDTDRDAAFPAEQLAALRAAGLMGLRADPAHGGAGEGLLTTCLVTEALAKACPSTALIYKMHLESIEMVCRVPTPAAGSRLRAPPGLRRVAVHGGGQRGRPQGRRLGGRAEGLGRTGRRRLRGRATSPSRS